jgi:hypothetical protein
MTSDHELSRDSETTGFQRAVLKLEKPTGSRPGAIGSVANREPSASLAALKPVEVEDRLLVSLTHIGGQRPVFSRKTMFPEGQPMYSIPVAVSWTCQPEAVDEARAAVEFSLRPAPEDVLAQALYRLRIVTRGRDRAGDDREAEAMIWIEELRRFPADIVLETLRTWPERSDGMWWPTWHDVRETIARQTAARSMLLWHITSWSCLPKPVDDLPAPDAASKARVRERAAAMRRAVDQPKPDPVVEAMRDGDEDRARQLLGERWGHAVE